MMKKIGVIFLLFSIVSNFSFSQFSDNFSDGDFSNSPSWEGNEDKFRINQDNELQLYEDPPAEGVSYLVTSSGVASNASWEFLVRFGFKTSGTNYADVYLMSNSPNLNYTTNGYFVRIGGKDKDICFYRKDPTGAKLLIKGEKDLISGNTVIVRLKVSREEQGTWTLSSDLTGASDFENEGMAIDDTYTSSCYFGIKCVYTKTRSRQMFFDDFIVSGDANLDNKAPEVLSVFAPLPAEVHLLFSEPVEEFAATNTENYKISHTHGHPSLAQIAPDNPTKVILQFSEVFENDKTYALTVQGMADLCNNVMPEAQTLTFMLGSIKAYDVLITEIMANPSSDFSLPKVKYIELHNRSNTDANMESWNLKIRNTSYLLPSYLLKSKDYLIVCKTADIPLFTNVDSSKIIGVDNFPSFSSKGAIISLQDNDGNIVHAVEFSDAWYKDNFKKNGGYSLEMIDVFNPCGQADNWAASNDMSGGTPARKNSIIASNLDKLAPYPTIVDVILPDTLVVYFNESLSLESINKKEYFSVDGIGNPVWILPVSPLFNEVKMKFDQEFKKGKIYSLDFYRDIQDCSANKIADKSSMIFAVGDSVENNDLVINEVLFNSKVGAKGFVEFYNRSQKNIDLKHLWISNKVAGTIKSSYRLTDKSRILCPGDYCAVTVDVERVLKEYSVPYPENIFQIKNMVTMPNDNGHILINDKNMNIIDELEYDKSMHYKLLASQKGVSLERVNFDQPTSSKTNWYSASQTVGFATPGYKNSQFADKIEKTSSISLSPEVFSPDNDGYNDRLIISYLLDEPGYTATIAIYDANGKFIKFIANNELLGVEGEFQWDGLDARNRLSPIGIYVVYVEMFHLNGKKIIEKHASVLSLRQ